MNLREAVAVAANELRRLQPRFGGVKISSAISRNGTSGWVSAPDRHLLVISSVAFREHCSVILTTRDVGSKRDDNLEAVAENATDVIEIVRNWKEKLLWWIQRLSIYTLKKGREYEVKKPFSDYWGIDFAGGFKFELRKRWFVPYDDLHTIETRNGEISLQGKTNREILENFDAYIQRLGADDA